MSKTSLGSHKYKFIETKESVYAREYSRKFVENMAILYNRDEIGEGQNQNVFWTCLSVPNKQRTISIEFCSAFSLYNGENECDHEGTRTLNLPIRSRTLYPLGHAASQMKENDL